MNGTEFHSASGISLVMFWLNAEWGGRVPTLTLEAAPARSPLGRTPPGPGFASSWTVSSSRAGRPCHTGAKTGPGEQWGSSGQPWACSPLKRPALAAPPASPGLQVRGPATPADLVVCSMGCRPRRGPGPPLEGSGSPGTLAARTEGSLRPGHPERLVPRAACPSYHCPRS